MRHIPKGDEPTALARYRQVRDASYDGSGFPHQELREALIRDQRGLCCFCMRRIVSDPAEMKVAHYVPRTVDSSLEIAWSNLLGACLGLADRTDRRPANQTCDTRQGSRQLLIDPRKASISSLIDYSIDGRISITQSSCTKESHEALQRDLNATLNLNHSALRKARREALGAAIQQLSRQKPEGPWKRRWLQNRLRDLSDSAVLPPFFGIIEHHLAKRIARCDS